MLCQDPLLVARLKERLMLRWIYLNVRVAYDGGPMLDERNRPNGETIHQPVRPIGGTIHQLARTTDLHPALVSSTDIFQKRKPTNLSLGSGRRTRVRHLSSGNAREVLRPSSSSSCTDIGSQPVSCPKEQEGIHNQRLARQKVWRFVI